MNLKHDGAEQVIHFTQALDVGSYGAIEILGNLIKRLCETLPLSSFLNISMATKDDFLIKLSRHVNAFLLWCRRFHCLVFLA
ncbi:hypothetical protein A8E86_17225 [Burkholderia cenocepacia]|nr:hypothetical protein A8E82_19490 [Burkholderia cenocepacia]ONV60122.1 hypothetical protein A8E76_14010 [Burkholderia cenocepacia]ONW01618.1 hypothetical protein A8E86_17225 [Burkholderia cenocepacia]